MRIVAWNCNMAFDRKREVIMALNPDIIILEEVSQKDIADSDAPFRHWIGSNPHKGLGVIGLAEHNYKIAASYTDDLPWFLPIEIKDLNINLLAAWAHVKSTQLRHVRVTHAAIDHYTDFITSKPTIIAGDFNSNSIWDSGHPGKSHSLLVNKLREARINSLYHRQTGISQGKETSHTLFMYRHPDKGYHIDYAFMTDDILQNAELSIGSPDEWLQYSDHMPLIIDIGPE